MREDEHPDLGATRHLGRLRGRRVPGLVRALPLLLGEAGVVDEHVGVGGDVEHRAGGARVARQDDLPARTGGPEHLVRAHLPAAADGDRLPALEPSEERPGRNAQRARRLDVEAARPRLLHERVAVRGHPVVDAEDDEPVAVPLERVAVAELDEVEPVGQLPEDAPERREELDEPRRPVHRERQLSPTQRERLQHARQAQVVVGVVVGEEDLAQVDQPDVGAEELALRSLPAVEQQTLAAAADEQARRGAAGGRNGPGRAEEDEIEVHAAKSTAAPGGERYSDARGT